MSLDENVLKSYLTVNDCYYLLGLNIIQLDDWPGDQRLCMIQVVDF